MNREGRGGAQPKNIGSLGSNYLHRGRCWIHTGGWKILTVRKL